MNRHQAVNHFLFGLLVLLAGTACGSLGEADQKTAESDTMAFAETSTTGTANGLVLEGAEKDAFLKAHNDARRKVGLAPFVWSDDIGRYSLQWIKQNHRTCYDAAVAGKPLPIKHRPREGEFKQKYGENLAWWGGSGSIEMNASRAVSLWIEEKVAFDKLNEKKPYVVGDESANQESDSKPIVVGHYTQIVWKETQRIGAARWTFKSRDRTVVLVVCNYDPPGNFRGEKPF